jgi:hypothetical protein
LPLKVRLRQRQALGAELRHEPILIARPCHFLPALPWPGPNQACVKNLSRSPQHHFRCSCITDKRSRVNAYVYSSFRARRCIATCDAVAVAAP